MTSLGVDPGRLSYCNNCQTKNSGGLKLFYRNVLTSNSPYRLMYSYSSNNPWSGLFSSIIQKACTNAVRRIKRNRKTDRLSSLPSIFRSVHYCVCEQHACKSFNPRRTHKHSPSRSHPHRPTPTRKDTNNPRC